MRKLGVALLTSAYGELAVGLVLEPVYFCHVVL